MRYQGIFRYLSRPGQALIALCLLFGMVLSFVPDAAAQLALEDWLVPVNLSRSGAATNPQMLMTADGQVRVIWQDTFAGVVYRGSEVSEDGTLGWLEPENLLLPFVGFKPVLAHSPSDIVHALWIGENGWIYASRARGINFGNSNSWVRPERLVTSMTAALDAAVDAQGQVHLVYLQTDTLAETPPGVYYIRSTSDARSWRPPVLLFESSYFRSLTPENARVNLAVSDLAEEAAIYVAWDNPARERVYFASSLDSGETWGEVREVDAPADGSTGGGPVNIDVHAQGSNVLLMWQAGHNGIGCSQYSLWSVDSGVSFTDRQQVMEEVPGCAEENKILIDPDGTYFLFTMVNSQVYLSAWNGEQWSQPQLQLALSNLIDPETFRPVNFGCVDVALGADRTIYLIGCDTNGGNDIWFTSRQLTDVEDWFTQVSFWNPLATVAALDQQSLLTPAVVTDSANRVHLVWSQTRSGELPGSPGGSISYARLEAGAWTSPITVLNAPEGIAEQPAIALDASGDLFLAWRGGQSGEIFFSRVNADQATIPAAWSEPKLLPAPQPAGSSPDILIGQDGAIYVVYAISLNEQRGIYLTRSVDGGETWEDPRVVFDAVAAGWEMVDRPYLVLTNSGSLHVLWTRSSIPSGIGTLGLYYSQSTDGGQTWAAPVAVVEKPIVWSQTIGTGNRVIHRLWQELSNGRMSIWHEQSLDDGASWRRVSPISIFGETAGEPALTADPAGRLHLLQFVSNGLGGFTLQHWMYDGESWTSDQSLDLGATVVSGLRNAVASVTTDGTLGVYFLGQAVDETTGVLQDNLFFASRGITIPAELVIQEEVAEVPEAASTPTPEPVEPSPTPQPITTESLEQTPIVQGQPEEPGNSWLVSVVGPVAVGLVALMVVFGISKIRAGR